MNRFYETTFKSYDIIGDDTGDGYCGGGSTIRYTSNIRKYLVPLLIKHNICSILDLPCGDLNWIKEIDLGDIQYIGADVASILLERNKRVFSNRSFLHLDITEDKLPQADLLLCRDCLFHFTKIDKIRALANFINNDIKYILMSHFPLCSNNIDTIRTGDFKEINWTISPFNFPEPIDIIDDSGIENSGNISPRVMALFTKDQIKDKILYLLESIQNILDNGYKPY